MIDFVVEGSSNNSYVVVTAYLGEDKKSVYHLFPYDTEADTNHRAEAMLRALGREDDFKLCHAIFEKFKQARRDFGLDKKAKPAIETTRENNR